MHAYRRQMIRLVIIIHKLLTFWLFCNLDGSSITRGGRGTDWPRWHHPWGDTL